MRLIIEIKNNLPRLILEKSRGKKEVLEISEERALSRKLLVLLDELLKKNQVKLEDLKKIEVKSDQSDNFTSTRIAKAVANALNWGKESDFRE